MFFDEDVDKDFTENGVIQVQLDSTNVHHTVIIKKEIYETYQRFAKRIMIDCGKSKNAGGSPIVFEALFGELLYDISVSVCVGMCVT